MCQDSFILQLQQDPQQHSVSSSEGMANPYDKTSTEAASPGRDRVFMLSVTIPSPAQTLPVLHKKHMAEFKIDYQVRRDNKVQESVYKVYLPSTYKGWAIMAEKEDAGSPRVEALQPDVSVGDFISDYTFVHQ